jgi:malate dehydrogenase
MINCIINDKRKILCCSVATNGEYGFKSLRIGLPAVIGKNGVETIMEIPLSEEEKTMLGNAAYHLQEMQNLVDSRSNN